MTWLGLVLHLGFRPSVAGVPPAPPEPAIAPAAPPAPAPAPAAAVPPAPAPPLPAPLLPEDAPVPAAVTPALPADAPLPAATPPTPATLAMPAVAARVPPAPPAGATRMPAVPAALDELAPAPAAAPAAPGPLPAWIPDGMSLSLEHAAVAMSSATESTHVECSMRRAICCTKEPLTRGSARLNARRRPTSAASREHHLVLQGTSSERSPQVGAAEATDGVRAFHQARDTDVVRVVSARGAFLTRLLRSPRCNEVPAALGCNGSWLVWHLPS